MKMRKDAAIILLQAYAKEWQVPWCSILNTKTRRSRFYLSVDYFCFEIETGAGRVDAAVCGERGCVEQFIYQPLHNGTDLLPLWGAFPTYTSVTSGWRQGDGEHYRQMWCTYYHALSPEKQAQYQQKYPAPIDAQRAWMDFYTSRFLTT